MKKVIDFLKQNSTMTMATSLNDVPRATVMEYSVVGDAFVFATDPSSIKVKNLEANGKISVSVYNMPKFVTLDGTVSKATKEQSDTYVKELLVRHPEFKELMEKGMMPQVFYTVNVKTAYYNDYSMGQVPTEVIKK